jgi:AraC-like DNA-binding protein
MVHTAPTASRAAIVSILDFADARRAGARSQLLAGLDATVPDDPDARMPAALVPLVLSKAAALLPEPHLGLVLATAANPNRHGLLDYLAATSATLGEAWQRIGRYIALWNEGMEIKVAAPAGSQVCLELRPTIAGVPEDGLRHLFGLSCATLVLAGRALTGGAASPIAIELASPAPTDPKSWSDVISVPLRFGAPSTRIVYPASDAELPVIGADSDLALILERYATELLAGRAHSLTWRGQVSEQIVRDLPKGRCDLPKVAKSLAVGERTLQRRLLAEGTTFEAVYDEARRGLALSYLRDRTLGVGEVAWLLGFADLSSFYRAFRRWTGSTPGDYRTSPG